MSTPIRGTVVAVCSAEVKGPKQAIASGRLVAGRGLEGDAHAGDWHRQLSLLDEAAIQTMRTRGLQLEPGAFGENLVLAGIELDRLGIGSVLQLGEAELELTQVGKVCHSRCRIYHQVGDCIMPRAGVFARVLNGGMVEPGALVRVLRAVDRATPQAAVVTVSDSTAWEAAADTSGPAVVRMLEKRLGAHIAVTTVVADEEDQLITRLHDLCDRALDLVITTGGTGCAARDRTPEATRQVIEREVPGLAEAMRSASSRITPHAWLQRGICGIRGSTLILNLPGSRKGATENLEAVLPVLGHAVALLRGDTTHPEHDRDRHGPGAPTSG